MRCVACRDNSKSTRTCRHLDFDGCPRARAWAPRESLIGQWRAWRDAGAHPRAAGGAGGRQLARRLGQPRTSRENRVVSVPSGLEFAPSRRPSHSVSTRLTSRAAAPTPRAPTRPTRVATLSLEGHRCRSPNLWAAMGFEEECVERVIDVGTRRCAFASVLLQCQTTHPRSRHSSDSILEVYVSARAHDREAICSPARFRDLPARHELPAKIYSVPYRVSRSYSTPGRPCT